MHKSDNTVYTGDGEKSREQLIGELTVLRKKLQNRADPCDQKHSDYEIKMIQIAKTEWESSIDCIQDIFILIGSDGKIRRTNRALTELTGKSYPELLGKNWSELMDEHGLDKELFKSNGAEIFHERSGRWFLFNSYPINKLTDSNGCGTVITIHDSTELKKVSEKLEARNEELKCAYDKLKITQSKILHQEKMASIGQLAAGVAHEINNPMGFIGSNLGTLKKYVVKLEEFINSQSGAIKSMESSALQEELNELRKKLKLDYILEDTVELINESLDGAERVKTIVQNLKSFSHVDEAEFKHADINRCIESTLNIVWNELKYKSTINKDYGDIPFTMCYPQQLNQVFMNLLVNAGQAIEKQGEISIKTWNDSISIYISIADTGKGIPEDKISKVFEPFFTTKEIGQGTGLGLSICYEIIKKHKGEITVESETGKGTVFTITIPQVEREQKA